jgi:hypothetical protein
MALLMAKLDCDFDDERKVRLRLMNFTYELHFTIKVIDFQNQLSIFVISLMFYEKDKLLN